MCPFSWKRRLAAVADKTAVPIDWQLMSLAVLNQGARTAASRQAPMRDTHRSAG